MIRYEIYVDLSHDAQLFSRSALSMFDALGNTGGISQILVSVSYSILAIFNFNKIENLISSQLYSESEANNRRLKPSTQSSFKDFLAQCCLPLGRKSRQEKLFDQARFIYTQETDIVNIIRKLRLIPKLVSKVIPANETA